MINIPEIKIKISFKNKRATDKLFKIGGAEDAYAAFKEIFNADTFKWTEEMILLCLDSANNIKGFYKVGIGGITATIADVRVIFCIALNCCATAIIIAHNHPSGSLKPSEADIAQTEQIKNAGALLNINLMDHLILSEDGFYSFTAQEIFLNKYEKKNGKRKATA